MKCAKCQEDKPEDAFRFKTATGGRYTTCILCEQRYRAQYYADLRTGKRVKVQKIAEKICRKCGVLKPISEFYYCKTTQVYNHTCKTCCRAPILPPGKKQCKQCGALKNLENFAPKRATCKECLDMKKPLVQKRKKSKDAQSRGNLYCYTCGQEKTRTDFATSTRCKQCVPKAPLKINSERNVHNRNQQILFLQGKKKCNCCGQELDLSLFLKLSVEATKPASYSSYCRACYREHYPVDRRKKFDYSTYLNTEGVCVSCKETKGIWHFPKAQRYKNICVECRKKAKWKKKHTKRSDHARFREKLNKKLKDAIKTQRNGSITKYLGCSVKDFREHIEKQFSEGMSWDNYGEWEIDHYVPIAYFKTINDIDKWFVCWNYKNLRPLWAQDNRSKSDTLPSDYLERIHFIRSTLLT